MKNRVISYILVIIGFFLIVFGLVLNFNSDNQKNRHNSSLENINDSQLSTKEINEIYQKEYNHSSQISKKHCLNNLCILNIKIVYEYNSYGVITGDLINELDKPVSDGFINLNFYIDDKMEVLHFYHPSLNSKENIPLELQFTNYNILKAKDYKIEYPSEEEILEYSKSW